MRERRRTKDEEGEEGEGEHEEEVASYPGGKRREKWLGIHGLCMHKRPHDFMGVSYTIVCEPLIFTVQLQASPSVSRLAIP